MDYNDREPIYLQIMNDIKYQMVVGKLKLGEQLPSIKEQSARMKVNPNTVARAYSELERQGIVSKQKGVGTFVSHGEDAVIKLKQEIADENVKRFVDGMYKIGFTDEEMCALVAKHFKRRRKHNN